MFPDIEILNIRIIKTKHTLNVKWSKFISNGTIGPTRSKIVTVACKIYFVFIISISGNSGQLA